MRVKVRFFSSFANLAGTNETEVDVPEGGAVGQVLEAVLERYPQLRQFRRYMILSVNNRVATEEARVAEGDVVGVMPPLGGG